MKQLISFLVLTGVIVGTLIGATVFCTVQMDKVTDGIDGVVDRVTDSVNTAAGTIEGATARFDKILAAFESENVTGITRAVVNPANLIKAENYTFHNGSSRGGIATSYDEDGVLTMNGKVATRDKVCLGERVILEKGYYTINVIADEPARTHCYITLYTVGEDGKETQLQSATFASPKTFYSEDLQYVKIYLEYAYGEEFNNYEVSPVLVPGEKMQSFFIEERVPVLGSEVTQ